MKQAPKGNLAETVYVWVKDAIFDFQLLPGDRFSESEIAQRTGASRTPVREALYRLEREGFVEVHSRSGWSVRPFDFQQFEELYDLRILLEEAAVKRLCELEAPPPALQALCAFWIAAPEDRSTDSHLVARQDEEFHCDLVAAAGNAEFARVHREVTERIRIIRRLDFIRRDRIHYTYEEHARILSAVLAGKVDKAQMLLRSHIEVSKAEVRRVTLHMLHTARERLAVERAG